MHFHLYNFHNESNNPVTHTLLVNNGAQACCQPLAGGGSGG